MRVVILCGGKGTRAYPHTESIPKAMMTVDGEPILLRVMNIFAAQGITDFILSLGWHKQVIIDFFRQNNFGWKVELVDTGEQTDTGGRIQKCSHLVGDTFMATYGDGLANVSIEKLLAFHHSHPGLATLTSAPLVSQFGAVEFDPSGRILEFKEKPRLHGHWINAGYFVFDKKIFEHWRGESLEREVFPNLLAGGHLYAYRHDGFFKSMDTYKDQQEIERMCQSGVMPWREIV